MIQSAQKFHFILQTESNFSWGERGRRGEERARQIRNPDLPFIVALCSIASEPLDSNCKTTIIWFSSVLGAEVDISLVNVTEPSLAN